MAFDDSAKRRDRPVTVSVDLPLEEAIGLYRAASSEIDDRGGRAAEGIAAAGVRRLHEATVGAVAALGADEAAGDDGIAAEARAPFADDLDGLADLMAGDFAAEPCCPDAARFRHEAIPEQWARERRALEWYAGEESIDAGVHGHHVERGGADVWVPDMGRRAIDALRGINVVDDAYEGSITDEQLEE